MEWQSSPSSRRLSLALGVPNLVVAVVGIAGVIHGWRIRPRRVGLHACRIHREQNALVPVLEGIEQHRNGVIAAGILAPGEVAANGRRR